MCSTPEFRVSRRGGVYVDVGERDLFYFELEDVVSYEPIHYSTGRALFRAESAEGHLTTVRVAWSVYKRTAQNRGYRGMQICEGMNCVPTLYTRDLHVIGSTFVEVTTRDYIEGQTLKEVWCDMDETERLNVAFQVEAFMELMSERVHGNFMALQGRNLSSPGPVDYLNYKIILSLITRDLRSNDCSTMDMENFPLASVLCHGNLSMDHIIVRGSALVGVVGWSKCDFIPEVMDRMGYQFSRPHAEGEARWYSHMASILLFHPPPPPLYTAACAQYCYMLRIRSTPEEYHERLREKLNEAYSLLMPSSKQSIESFDYYAERESSDLGSHLRHLEAKADSNKNPFTDCYQETTPVTSTNTSRSSSLSGWSENSTILDILDHLSVT